jgi:phage shock protein A
MKGFLYWLLGDRGGSIVVGTWNWLIGGPIEKGDAQTVAIAQQSLEDIGEKVIKMTNAVSHQYAALQQAKELLAQMQSNAASLAEQSEQLVRSGYDNDALSVLGELEVIEASMPPLEAQVTTASKNFEDSKLALGEMQRQLNQMKTQQKISASMQKVTAALEEANSLSGISSDKAINVFEASQNAIKNRAITETAKLELSSFGKSATRKTNEISAAQRLAALKQKVNPQLEGKSNNDP